MGEEWRVIGGYDGMYEVSDLGRVRSWYKNKWGRRDEPRMLKPYYRGKGYANVWLHGFGLSKNRKIHQLVAESFISESPDGMMVDHINGIRDDNRVENLEYVTNRENVSRGHMRRTNSSDHIGVSFDKNAQRWVSWIYHTGKRSRIAYSKSESVASDAYQHMLKFIDCSDSEFTEEILKARKLFKSIDEKGPSK